MIFEPAISFTFPPNPICVVDFFADKSEFYIYASMMESQDYPDKHTILVKLTACTSFYILPDASAIEAKLEEVFKGIYRSTSMEKISKPAQFELSEVTPPPRGKTCFLFRTQHDYLYVAYAETLEVAMTWPPTCDK